MTVHPIGPSDLQHRLDFIEARLNDAWETIPELEARIHTLEDLLASREGPFVAGVSLSAPSAAALRFMGTHRGLGMNATQWARNGGGTFSASCLPHLLGLGLIDRDAVRTFRINDVGLAWLDSHEGAS